MKRVRRALRRRAYIGGISWPISSTAASEERSQIETITARNMVMRRRHLPPFCRGNVKRAVLVGIDGEHRRTRGHGGDARVALFVIIARHAANRASRLAECRADMSPWNISAALSCFCGICIIISMSRLSLESVSHKEVVRRYRNQRAGILISGYDALQIQSSSATCKS